MRRRRAAAVAGARLNGAIAALDAEGPARDNDLVFALPDTAAAELAPTGPRRVRASSICPAPSGCATPRLERAYPETRAVPEGAAHGLTELERESIAGARLLANPGCYPTATLLALSPLAEAGLLAVNSDVIVDAKSGVSGAGKTPSERTHFSECHGSISAYGVFNHRHAAEIEQGLGGPVTFVPHLVPLDRGILATITRVPPDDGGRARECL